MTPGAAVPVRPDSFPPHQPVVFDLTHQLFVLSGAFEGDGGARCLSHLPG